MDIEVSTPLQGRKRNMWRDFLSAAGLEADLSVEQTVLIWDGDTLAATGSRQGNLLKCIAVAPAYQGEGLLASILTTLRQQAFHAGHRHLFLYTKPQNSFLFSELFFYPVARTENVLLMEDQKNGIQNFVHAQASFRHTGHIGAAVMNCDPFTLGHQYLIETAAKSCDHLYVFVLSEDQGRFSSQARMEMVRRGTAHISNVTVLPTGPYLISRATFPTYFLKKRDQADEIHCQLDVEIFTRYFVPAFGITTRFVGTEPLSALTNRYNAVLKETLPTRGVKVVELPRLSIDNTPISASAVREAYQIQDWSKLQKFVPASTYEYLLQEESL